MGELQQRFEESESSMDKELSESFPRITAADCVRDYYCSSLVMTEEA